jgi:hypothetical protein
MKTTWRRLWFSGLMVGALLLSGCAAAAEAGIEPTADERVSGPIVGEAVSPASSGPLTDLPTATPKPVLAGDSLTLTGENNGQTLELQVGQRFSLKLGEGYRWSGLTVADPTVAAEAVGVTPEAGMQGVFEALKAGETKVSMMGDPECRFSQPPCGMPSIEFSLTVVVK